MAIDTTALIAALLLGGCGQDPQPAGGVSPDDQVGPSSPPVAADGPSLVLVTLDTTRADRIGCYGHESAHTPAIDGLASQGWLFEHAYASVPLTTPSHATILSGLYPTRHGIHSNGDAVLPEQVDTLAEILAGEGYRTAASVAAFTTTRIWNFDQGFEVYSDEVSSDHALGGRWARERPADQVVDDAVAWLGGIEGEPWFLWVHFFDPHDPYLPPEPWASQFPGHPYDGEIAFMDDQIGRLVQAVGARGEDVNWIVVGDHGEALGYEHGEHNHGLFLYQETMHVPLVVRPAQPLARPAVISKPAVSTADVLPTALGLLGVPTPDGLDGRDLGPLLRGEPMDHPGAYMESHTALKRFGYHPEVAWTDGVHKLMDTPTPHLYDLSSDPGETINLLPKEASTAASLRVPLQAVLDSKVDSEVLAPDPGVAQQLEALGYLDGGFTLDPDQDPTVDAKDRVELITELERLRILALDVKKMPEVVSAYQAVLVKEPRMVEGHMGLARAYQRMGKPRLARQALEAALVLQPESTILKANLANSLAAEGRHTDGLALMESILAVVPRDDIAQVGVLRMLSDLDRREEALARADAWLAEDPDNPAIEAHRGVLLARLSRYSEAEAILEASLRDGVPRQFVHRFLAIIALDRSEPAVAARHLKRELDAFPGSRDERIMLADVLTRLGAWDEAAAEYAFLAETEPGDHHWAHNHAQCVFNTADYERAGEILAPLLEVSEPLPEVLLLRANILGKQGLMEEGQAMFERANEAKQAERAGGPPE